MNKFSDGFSDSSYEDLLNEYAGETLGSRAGRRGEDRRSSSRPKRTPGPTADPVFDAEVKRNAKSSDYSLDLNMIKTFEEENAERERARQREKEELARKAEQARQAERARQAEIRRQAEKARQAELARKAEAARKEELARKAALEERKRQAERRAFYNADDFGGDLFSDGKDIFSDSNDLFVGSDELFSSFEDASPRRRTERAPSEEYKPRRAAPQKKSVLPLDKLSINNLPVKRARRADVGDNGNAEAKRSKKLSFNDIAKFIVISVQNHKKGFIIAVCCLVVSIAVSSLLISCINDIFAINRSDDTPVEVVLPNEPDAKIAIDTLHDAGLIKNKWFCYAYIQIMGMGDGTKKKYRPGVYYFDETMGVEKMNTRFKESAVKGNYVSITIPEGFTIDQVVERLEKNGICSASALYTQLDTIDFSKDYDFIKSLDNKDKRYHVLEGYIYPATYEFEQGADPADVVRKFLDTFKSRWTKDYQERANELGMTVDDIIKLASIIEKEGKNPEQFKQISSVLHNRLNRSLVYPNFECNSTLDYFNYYIAQRVSSPAKRVEFQKSYDTYNYPGYPASAICNPGPEAIKAALYPETSGNYFFRHDKYGEIYLAKTYEEHLANEIRAEKASAK